MSAPTPARRAPVEEELSLPLFFANVVISLAAFYGLFWLCAPESIFRH